MHTLKCFIVVTLFAAISETIAAQSASKPFADCTNLFLYEAYNGDTVLVHCDTVMLMNRSTFLSYKKSFEKLRNGNASIKDIIDNYENTIRIQTSMLTRQEGYYQNLKSKLDSMSTMALSVIDRTNNNISVIQTSLGNASGKLEDTQALLLQSKQMLIDERRQQLKQKLQIGIGSFGVGVGVTAILFLLGRHN